MDECRHMACRDRSLGARRRRLWAAVIVCCSGLVAPTAAVAAKSKAVVAGAWHTCALTASRGVECWGQNTYGQLGDGSSSGPEKCLGPYGVSEPCSTTPVNVEGLSGGVKALSAGGFHTCALTTAGGVECWGLEAGGLVTTPVGVPGLTSGVKAVTAGLEHACALVRGGGVECWGSNLFGQLGDGTTTPKTTPVPVLELHHGVKAISAGYYNTCALLTDGGVKCWGINSGGGLGDGSIGGPEASCECAVKPVEVSGLQSGVKAISSGGYHSCALTAAGAVKCWGENDYTELGDGTNVDKGTPVEVSGLSSGINAISAGGYHTCVLTTAHAAECLGDNAAGQLGDGTDVGPYKCTDGSACSGIPVEVIELSGVKAISASSGMHTCALARAGSIKCWGENAYGELGDGTTSNRSAPVEVSGL